MEGGSPFLTDTSLIRQTYLSAARLMLRVAAPVRVTLDDADAAKPVPGSSYSPRPMLTASTALLEDRPSRFTSGQPESARMSYVTPRRSRSPAGVPSEYAASLPEPVNARTCISTGAASAPLVSTSTGT